MQILHCLLSRGETSHQKAGIGANENPVGPNENPIGK